MELSEEKKPIKSDIQDKIMMKVSSFPSIPQAGIKLRALLAEIAVSNTAEALAEYIKFSEKTHSWMNKLFDTLTVD